MTDDPARILAMTAALLDDAVASGLGRLDPAKGRHRPGCDLSVRTRPGAVLRATEPGCCIVRTRDGEDAVEDYRLAFDGARVHIVRRARRMDGVAIGRADAVPYRLHRLASSSGPA